MLLPTPKQYCLGHESRKQEKEQNTARYPNRDHDNLAARLIMPQDPDPYFATAARYVVKTGNTRFSSSLRGGVVPLPHSTRVMQQLQRAGIISSEQPYTVIVRDMETLEKVSPAYEKVPLLIRDYHTRRDVTKYRLSIDNTQQNDESIVKSTV